MTAPVAGVALDGWMPWMGGENPAPGKVVECRWRGDYWRGGNMVSSTWLWTHSGSYSDIIAYRIAPDAPALTDGEGRPETPTAAMVRLQARVFDLEAQASAYKERVEALEKTLKAFIKWGDQQCLCYDDKPDPCPLCDASIANLQGCKAVDAKFPPRILADARALLNGADR